MNEFYKMNPTVLPWPHDPPQPTTTSCPCCEDISQNANRQAHEFAMTGAAQQANQALDNSRKHLDTKGLNLDYAVDMMAVCWSSAFRQSQKHLQNQSQHQYINSVYTKQYQYQNQICSYHAEFYKFS